MNVNRRKVLRVIGGGGAAIAVCPCVAYPVLYRTSCGCRTVAVFIRDVLSAMPRAGWSSRPCWRRSIWAAKKAGASRQEVTEASLLAAALRAGGAATHGAMALKFYDKE